VSFLLNDYTKAILYFEEAVKNNPGHAEAYAFMGSCKSQLGRYQEAVEAHKQAIRIKPDYAFAHYGLGLAHLVLGDKSSALERYKILKLMNQEMADDLFNLIYR